MTIRHTVLIIDDEPPIRRLIQAALTRAGYATAEAGNAREALEQLRIAKPDVSLLDLGLPDRDGLELVPLFKQQGDTTLIIISARDATDEKVAALDLGADDYLTKPFSFDELLARLNVMIRRSAVQSQDRIVLDGLVVDVRGRAARVEEVSLPLSRREFDLLHCLARQAGQVVTRGQILDEVWGQDAEVTENAVDVYVGYLRKHLIRHDGAPDLSTVRGVGFLLRHRTKA